MIMRNWFLLLFVLFVPLGLTMKAEAAAPTLAMNTITVNEELTTLATVLGMIATQTHTAIVLESSSTALRFEHPVHINDLTVPSALTSLTAIFTGYDWTKSGSGFIFYQRDKNSLCQLAIKRFKVNYGSVYLVRQDLLNIPEVRGWLSSRKITERTFNTGNLSSPGVIATDSSDSTSFEVQDVTFGEVLIRIEESSKRYFATVISYGQSRNFISLSL